MIPRGVALFSHSKECYPTVVASMHIAGYTVSHGILWECGMPGLVHNPSASMVSLHPGRGDVLEANL